MTGEVAAELVQWDPELEAIEAIDSQGPVSRLEALKDLEIGGVG